MDGHEDPLRVFSVQLDQLSKDLTAAVARAKELDLEVPDTAEVFHGDLDWWCWKVWPK